jgi:4-aminobutyrate--pyruvate transaminase
MSDRGNSPASRDIASVLHPYTNLDRHAEVGPLVITRGQGIKVFDEAGKDYVEAMAGLWCASLGFSEPRLAEAAHRQMLKLPFYHGFTHKSHEPMIALAEKLLELAPVPMARVFFCNSGSEANDTAIKLAWYVNNALGRPEKKKIIARTRAYHGVTVATASLTALPINQTDFDLPIARILHTDCPHFYRFGEKGESAEDFATRCAENLEKLILAEGPETVAAFFAEPVMGAGGVIVPPPTYFEKIQAVLKKYQVMLIADEVITGFGRTGNWFGSQTFGLKPNMMSLAKGLSSGYLPIAALMVDEGIHEALKTASRKIGLFGHGYTYSGHPVPAAVALEALAIYEERDIVGHVRSLAPYFQAALRRFVEHPLVGEARGVGLIGALELVEDKESRKNFDPKRGVGPYLVARAQEHGLITRSMIGDAIAFSPPLIITEAEIDELFARLSHALDETWKWVNGQ